jgi:hypothetical protein
MTYHRIPQDQGDDKIVQCTESYDPTQPCYICSLIKDLDDAAHNQNESVLNAEYLGERLANVLIENSPVYCRSILLPFIAKSRVAMVPGKQDPNKPQRKLYPDPSSITTGVLNIQPDKPETKFGGCSFPDRPFHRKLQILTLTDQDINERYQHLHMRDPAAAAAFYAEAAPAFRNPYLFDAQHGSWVYFNKGKKGTPMSLVCQPPSPLDTLLVTKFLSEKTYPNIRDWGKGGDTKTGTRLSWYEVLATVRYSWVGKSLENEKGWSLDLNQEDWMPRSPGF